MSQSHFWRSTQLHFIIITCLFFYKTEVAVIEHVGDDKDSSAPSDDAKKEVVASPDSKSDLSDPKAEPSAGSSEEKPATAKEQDADEPSTSGESGQAGTSAGSTEEAAKDDTKEKSTDDAKPAEKPDEKKDKPAEAAAPRGPVIAPTTEKGKSKVTGKTITGWL